MKAKTTSHISKARLIMKFKHKKKTRNMKAKAAPLSTNQHLSSYLFRNPSNTCLVKYLCYIIMVVL
jgi:hypothetical protein